MWTWPWRCTLDVVNVRIVRAGPHREAAVCRLEADDSSDELGTTGLLRTRPAQGGTRRPAAVAILEKLVAIVREVDIVTGKCVMDGRRGVGGDAVVWLGEGKKKKGRLLGTV